MIWHISTIPVHAIPTRITRNIHLPRQVWMHVEQAIWVKAILKDILRQEAATLAICVRDLYVLTVVANALAVI